MSITHYVITLIILFVMCVKKSDVPWQMAAASVMSCLNGVWKMGMFIANCLMPSSTLHDVCGRFRCSFHMIWCLSSYLFMLHLNSSDVHCTRLVALLLYLFLMCVNNSAVHFTWFGAWLLITSRCVWKIKITAHASMPSSLPVHVTMSNHCRWFDA